MRVAINAQALTEPGVRQRGAGRVLSALLHELLPRLAREEVVLFANYAGLDVALPPSGRRVATRWPVQRPLGRAAWEWLALPSLLRRERADVLLTPSMFPATTTCPRIVLCPEVNALFTPQGHLDRAPVARLRCWRAAASLRAADRVVTVTTRTAQRLTRALGVPADRVQVAPMGGPPSDLAAAAERRIPDYLIPPKYVLWSGSEQTRTGLRIVLEAFGRVADLIPHQLVLIGEAGRDLQVTRSAVARAGLQPRVLCLGALPEEWSPAIVRRATAFLYPMADDEFARPVLEAFACGTTVIAGNVGSLPDLCGVGALLFDPFNADQLAGLLLDVIREAELRARQVQKGHERLAEFSWDTAAATVYHLLLRVVEERRSASQPTERISRHVHDPLRASAGRDAVQKPSPRA